MLEHAVLKSFNIWNKMSYEMSRHQTSGHHATETVKFVIVLFQLCRIFWEYYAFYVKVQELRRKINKDLDCSRSYLCICFCKSLFMQKFVTTYAVILKAQIRFFKDVVFSVSYVSEPPVL